MSENLGEKLEKESLAKIGVQFGTVKRFKTSLMKDYIFSYRNRRCILDLEKILESCLTVKDVIFSLLKEEKKIFFFYQRFLSPER